MTNRTSSEERYFTIRIIAEMLGIHQQTLRLYEKRGLIRPSRTQGNTRLYSQDDVDQVRRIQRLIAEFGVNLAGVEIILEMRDRLTQLQEERLALQRIIEQLMTQLVALTGEEIPQEKLVRACPVRAVRPVFRWESAE